MKCLALVVLLTALATPVLAQTITVVPAPPSADPPPSVTDAAQRAAVKPIHARKIILIGDSTTQVGSGWGGSFCANHVTSALSCLDLARGGRGTFDYRAEGSWDLALAEMKTPGYDAVYVLIQFGHNDQPGKPGRSTDLYREFPDNLRHYVSDVRATGAIPVLVTPLTRRSFKDGSLQDDLEPWAEAVRTVAKEMNVPLVDLHRVSADAVQAMGPRAAIALAETAPPDDVLAAADSGTTISAPKTTPPTPVDAPDAPQGHPTVVFDYTHLGAKGADVFSAMVAAELARAVPELRPYLVSQLYPPHP